MTAQVARMAPDTVWRSGRDWPAALGFSGNPVAVALLAVLAASLLALAATFAWPPERIMPPGLAIAPGRLAAPATLAPALPDPSALLPIPADKARLINAAVPFATTAVVPAAPYRFTGSDADRAAATACLSAAVLYEAGDDAAGQAAVAQVVLNRLRHPAFPKTVCGVIFQGSERATGCQFTFTCDGALARALPDAAWKRAEAIATAALAGGVDRRVGTATHYHTDWVVPAWSAQLDKIAKVGTHLFFRWRGAWGAAATLTGVRHGVEPIDPRLAIRFGLAAPHDLTVTDEVLTAEASPVASAPSAQGRGLQPSGVDLRGARVHLADEDAGVFVLALPPGRFAGDYAMASLDLCRGRGACTVFGYLRADRLPGALPLARGAAAQASFYYEGDGRGYWNCAEISRANPADCIPGTGAMQAARPNPSKPPS